MTDRTPSIGADGLTRRDRDLIRDVLARYPDVRRVTLFGSRAMGTFGRGSDIDLAFEGRDLDALWQERSLTTDDAGYLTQKPDAETRTALHHLVEAGLVEDRGQRKGRTWHLSAAAYRALSAKSAYIRQRGFEPLQQEQMVIQYVEKHGRITRHEAAELCRVAPYQATRLLGRLVKDGRLVRHGERKTAWYERRTQV